MGTIKMPDKPNIGQNLFIFGIVFAPFILSGLLSLYRIGFWFFLIFWLIVAFPHITMMLRIMKGLNKILRNFKKRK